MSINEAKQELYYVLELMEIDLHKIITKSEQVLTEPHVKCLMKQILEGLKAMHSLGIYHRDMKPANILVNQDCQLRITDFGLARYVGKGYSLSKEDHEVFCDSLAPMTEYVVTRWYRAPELLLAPGAAYSEAIDIWSAGCILAEMFLRKPLFPGDGYIDQVQKIFRVSGFNDPKELGFLVNKSNYEFLISRCLCAGQPYSSLLPGVSSEALQLVEALLKINPNSRPSANLALLYPFFADAETLFDYTSYETSPPPPDYFSFEHLSLDTSTLVEMIRKDVQRFSNEQLEVESSIHTSRTSIESAETAYEQSTTDSHKPIDRMIEMESLDAPIPTPRKPFEDEHRQTASSMRRDRENSALNPFGNHNSNSKRRERQRTFPSTFKEPDPNLVNIFSDAESTDESTVALEKLNSETTTSLAVSAHQESGLLVGMTGIAVEGDLGQDSESTHVTQSKSISSHHVDKNLLHPIQKQSKFSQSKGFPFTGLGRSRSGRRRSEPSGVSAVQTERTTFSVLSSFVMAPFHLPSLVHQPQPQLQPVPSLTQLEEGTAYDDSPSNVATANVVPVKQEKRRTQRFSIDPETRGKSSLPDAQPRASQKKVSFIFSNVTVAGFPKESDRKNKYIDLNSEV